MNAREKIKWLRGYAPTQPNIIFCARILDVCDMAAVAHDLFGALDDILAVCQSDLETHFGSKIGKKARAAIAKAKQAQLDLKECK